MRFRPYTYARNQQFLPPLWAAINVWLNMMPGHGANLIPFNKKNKYWTSRTLANPPIHPLTSNNISFLPYPTSPLKWTSYVYHSLLDHIPLCSFGLILQVPFSRSRNIFLVVKQTSSHPACLPLHQFYFQIIMHFF